MYVAFGGKAQDAAAMQTKAPLPGLFFHAAAGKAARDLSDALKLQYTEPPRLYVFDLEGKLAGFGTLQDLPRLLGRVVR